MDNNNKNQDTTNPNSPLPIMPKTDLPLTVPPIPQNSPQSSQPGSGASFLPPLSSPVVKNTVSSSPDTSYSPKPFQPTVTPSSQPIAPVPTTPSVSTLTSSMETPKVISPNLQPTISPQSITPPTSPQISNSPIAVPSQSSVQTPSKITHPAVLPPLGAKQGFEPKSPVQVPQATKYSDYKPQISQTNETSNNKGFATPISPQINSTQAPVAAPTPPKTFGQTSSISPMQGVVSEIPKSYTTPPVVPSTNKSPYIPPIPPSNIPNSQTPPNPISQQPSPLASTLNVGVPSNPASSQNTNNSVALTSSPPKKSAGKFISILLLFLLIIGGGVGAVYWYFFNPNNANNAATNSGPVTLTYWGLWEPEEVMKPIIAQYQQANPNVTINYQNSSPTEYAQRLRNALASDTPPDIFRMHNTWVYMFPNLLSQVPANIYTSEEFSQTFYPVASKNLTVDGKLVGIPLMYDGLALYYNVELFKRAGVENPPVDWEQFVAVARKITAPETGALEVSGAAMGTANNITHWPDIMSLLLLQNDANPGSLLLPSGELDPNATDALTFYSLFSYRYKTWDATWPQDVQQFALGKVGMFFGPSWQVFNIKNIAQNNKTDLDFRVIPVPQLPETNVTFASYWAEGVSAKSKNQAEAWKFIKYLSTKEVMLSLYQEQSKIREFGEIPSRKDLADQFLDHPYIGAYLKQAQAAKSFPLVSTTTDKDGINDSINKAYQEAVNTSSKGTSASAALEPTASKVLEVLKNYGLAQ